MPSTLQPTSKAAWAQRSVHTVTCPSGAVVRIRIPDLSMLLAQDAVPDRLRAVALQKVSEAFAEALRTPVADPAEGEEPSAPTLDVEALKELAELHQWLVTQMLVEPELTLEDLEGPVEERPPGDDLTMLVQIASRERHTDARGVVLGVEPLSRWERFRDRHGCGEDCRACQEVVGDFSSLDPRPL